MNQLFLQLSCSWTTYTPQTLAHGDGDSHLQVNPHPIQPSRRQAKATEVTRATTDMKWTERIQSFAFTFDIVKSLDERVNPGLPLDGNFCGITNLDATGVIRGSLRSYWVDCREDYRS